MKKVSALLKMHWWSNTLVIGSILLFSCEPSANQYLLRFEDDQTGMQGYKYTDGTVAVAAGKYPFCFTDTFRTYAIVAHPDFGIAAINRNEKVLYRVFSYDNGPDPISDGLFRIVKDGKIGYANKAGEEVIAAKYMCAYPFQNNVAKVAHECETLKRGEHASWISTSWFFIDKHGNEVPSPDQLEP